MSILYSWWLVNTATLEMDVQNVNALLVSVCP